MRDVALNCLPVALEEIFCGELFVEIVGGKYLIPESLSKGLICSGAANIDKRTSVPIDECPILVLVEMGPGGQARVVFEKEPLDRMLAGFRI